MIAHDGNDLIAYGKTVNGEARGEARLGQIAVGWVIRNRAENPSFAGSYIGRIGALYHVCHAALQFSCWNSDDPNKERLDVLALEGAGDTYKAQYDLCVSIADDQVLDPTGGADHYFTVATPPGVSEWPPVWAKSMQLCGQVGHQLFYNSRHGTEGQHRVLYLNCHPGDDVKAVQHKLGCVEDGTYGILTQAAIETFQRMSDLVVDGVVGPLTHAALGV